MSKQKTLIVDDTSGENSDKILKKIAECFDKANDKTFSIIEDFISSGYIENLAKILIYQAEKMPTEFKDKISDDDKETIKKAVAEAKEQLEKSADDKEKLEEATKALNDAIMPIGAKLYQAAADDKKDDKSEDKKDDGTVEGEVVDK